MSYKIYNVLYFISKEYLKIKAKSVINFMGFYGIRQLYGVKALQAEDAQQVLTNALSQWA